MPFYKITYRQGKTRLNKVIEAPNRNKALLAFNNLEHGIVVDIQESLEPLTSRWDKSVGKYKNPIKNKKVRQEEYIAFLDQLATMLDAGMPVNGCLEQCIEDTNDKSIKAIFTNVLADIESGQSLTQSTQKYRVQLSNLSISLFNLGEQTGTLANSIMQLSEILTQIHENRQKFKKATRYPLFIIIAMAIAFSVVITFVVPQFKSFFEQSGLELPLPTKALLWTESYLTNYGLYTLGGIFLIVFFITYMYKKSSTWKFQADKIILKIYIIGKVTYFAMIGRFVYLFEVLADAGIPMLDAIEIAKSVVDNSFIRSRLDLINSAVEDGKTLTQGFRDSEQFENMVVQMVQAGESSGSLGKMLSKVNRIYTNKYNYIIDNIATLIEPLLIAAIACFVLVLALGIFLPMWSMVDLAG